MGKNRFGIKIGKSRHMNLQEVCDIITKFGAKKLYMEVDGHKVLVSYKARMDNDKIRMYLMNDGELADSYLVDGDKLRKLIETKQYKDSLQVLTLVTVAVMWDNGQAEVYIKDKNVSVKYLG